jgi:hypothetical protein
MRDTDRLLIDIENRFDEGNSIEEVLRYLRSNGFSVLDSIKVTMRLTGVSLAEAKQVVHTSEAWSDRRAMHDAFHRGLIGETESLRGDEALRGRMATKRGGGAL